ncbi:MAG: hypothetical protein L0H63_02150 [Nitrococcus sp.]|nr:hypothetical protein [Nitrococcus sp.]
MASRMFKPFAWGPNGWARLPSPVHEVNGKQRPGANQVFGSLAERGAAAPRGCVAGNGAVGDAQHAKVAHATALALADSG